MEGREVIFEFRSFGNIMKVTAMDVASMTEVTIQCPAAAGEKVFKQNALKKLEYVLRNKGIID
jgi:hypothetical protein